MRLPEKAFWLAGAVAGAVIFAAPWLLAQPLPPGTVLTGNELVNITTQGGSGAQLSLPQVRNATNITTNFTTTGSIGSFPVQLGTLVLAAALTGATSILTPPTPYDGEFITVANGTASAFTQTFTLTANTGQTVNAGAAATMPANSSVEWQYSANSATWYRLR